MDLGICDWGIGGLGVYGLLKRSRPDIAVTYLADQGSTAYSLLSKLEVELRVEHMLRTFNRLGVTNVVFASAAASTALDDVSVPSMSVTGVIEPALRAMRGAPYREVGVIGGRRTILSGAFGRSLRKQRFCVLQRVSLDLSLAIENGQANTPETRQMLVDLLEPLAKVDCLLLACSHYRVITPILRELLPQASIVDPVDACVAEVLERLPQPDREYRSDVFYTTGDPRAMERHAASAFGVKLRVQTLSAAHPELAA